MNSGKPFNDVQGVRIINHMVKGERLSFYTFFQEPSFFFLVESVSHFVRNAFCYYLDLGREFFVSRNS